MICSIPVLRGSSPLVAVAVAFAVHTYHLHGQDHKMIRADPGLIQAVAVSPNGSRFAVAFDDSRDTLLCKMDDAGRVALKIRGEHGHARSLAFSKDGKVLAVPDTREEVIEGQPQSGVRLWDAESGKELTHFFGHDSYVTAVEFSPKGDLLATGDDMGNVLLWDVAKSLLLRKLPAHKDEVTALSFENGGKVVVSASKDRRVQISDSGSGKLTATLKGHDSWVLAVGFSSDGKKLFTADGNGHVRRWGFPEGKLDSTFALKHGKRSIGIAALAFSEGGEWIATVEDAGQTVRLWDAADGAEMAKFEHTKGSTLTCLAFTSDGRHLVSCGQSVVPLGKSEIRIWDLSGFESRREKLKREGKLAPASDKDKK